METIMGDEVSGWIGGKLQERVLPLLQNKWEEIKGFVVTDMIKCRFGPDHSGWSLENKLEGSERECLKGRRVLLNNHLGHA